MAIPSWLRSPRPQDNDHEAQPPIDSTPASQSSSRFNTLHHNVRSMIAGSSIYTPSPSASNNNTPKLPFLGIFRRPQSPPNPIAISPNDIPRDSSDSRSPLRPQHTAGSYMRAIAPSHDPPEPEMVYRHPADRYPAERHPADVPLPQTDSIDPETAQLQEEAHRRRRHRRRRRKHGHGDQCRATHWVRRKQERGFCFSHIRSHAARSKAISCSISGFCLLTVLAIYLTIALTSRMLAQEVHILFILVILATTIFFCHALIRMCMLMLHPPPADTPRIPNMTGPEGFHPVRPIRVHLARDEEFGDAGSSDEEDARDGAVDVAEKNVAPPPPAYGLWRSSVRVDPNLLHWQRVGPESPALQPPPLHQSSRNGSVSSATGSTTQPQPHTQPNNASTGRSTDPSGPRPPSYASEDGVSYVVEAAPRSTVYAPSLSGVSDIHPAYRPGYAISDIRADEWPAPRRL